MGTRALILFALALAGCAGTPSPLHDPRAVWCENNVPRRDYRPDMPRVDVDELNAHNAKGVLWCDWKPDVAGL